MPIDALTSLSFAIQSNPGVYALLLGSGVSSAAGILTGWGVTLDLIRQVAASQNQRPPDPELWYREKFSAEPDYSVLLSELGKTERERPSCANTLYQLTKREKLGKKFLPQLTKRLQH